MLIISLIVTACFAREPEFLPLQWGLKNSGQAQKIELDHISNYKVQARAGQDIQWQIKGQPRKKTNKKILVAVLDTGIDKTHPALKGVIHRNESECKALEKYLACVEKEDKEKCDKIWFDLKNPEVDQDHNGYPMDCQGWSTLGKVNPAGIMGTPDFSDDQGHGTHVAGIIAAGGDEAQTMGVSQNVEILPVQVLGKKPSEPLKPLSVDISPGEAGKDKYQSSLGDFIARGVNYAIASGAKVINFSLGWPETFDSTYLREVIAEAQKRGIIIVAAAGNDSTRALLRPCAYPGVICVASHGPDGSLSHFSNYGTGIEVAAPGTNILSTYPMDQRPVRFKSTQGYEFLHGTSQASPFVAGIVAELLAEGIPQDEIYPRLVLGSRPLQIKLPLLSGPANDMKAEIDKPEGKSVEVKYLLGGLASLQGALDVKAQALIVPTTKEKKEIIWNRKDSKLTLEFTFKNMWKAISMSEVKLKLQFLKPDQRAIRPQIISYRWIEPSANWNSNEEKKLQVIAEINDSKSIKDSRIPSDLDLVVDLTTSGMTRRMIMESEIIVNINKEDTAYEQIPLDLKEHISSWLYVDENYDDDSRHDYFGKKQSPSGFEYTLIRQDSSAVASPYKSTGNFAVSTTDEDQEAITESLRVRLPNHQYALGLVFDRSDAKPKDDNQELYSSLKIFLLSPQFQSQASFEISNDSNQLPSRVTWQKVGGEYRPTWTGLGHDPDKKASLRDDWENPDQNEKPEFRLYYFNLERKLKAIKSFQGYQVADILEPSLAQITAGKVPILLAKNRGTENKNSYIFDFAVAEVTNGEVINFQPLTLSLDQRNYRNLLDTRVNKAMSLAFIPATSLGTFWYGEGAQHTQRVSMLIPNESFTDFKFYDQSLPALRGTVDSTLQVSSAFYSPQRAGVFAITNSELQYHDLLHKNVSSRSLERYTFWEDYIFTSVHFPIVMQDELNPNVKIPALFVTESSGLAKGVRIKAPVFDDKTGELIEISTPAKLRFRADREKGCRPLNAPLFEGKTGAASFDYYCGDKIIRVPLIY